MPDIPFAITIDLNIDDLPHPRPFDLEGAERMGAITLCDPLDDDESMKDIEARWPCERLPAMSYGVWMRLYGLPMLQAGGRLRVSVEHPMVRAGIHQAYKNADPTPFCQINRNGLAGDAGAKLEAIKAILR